MKSDIMKEFEREIEEARQTGKSDFDYVFWDYCTEDASPEVIALCEAARKAHKATLLEWERKHPRSTRQRSPVLRQSTPHGKRRRLTGRTDQHQKERADIARSVRNRRYKNV